SAEAPAVPTGSTATATQAGGGGHQPRGPETLPRPVEPPGPARRLCAPETRRGSAPDAQGQRPRGAAPGSAPRGQVPRGGNEPVAAADGGGECWFGAVSCPSARPPRLSFVVRVRHEVAIVAVTQERSPVVLPTVSYGGVRRW